MGFFDAIDSFLDAVEDGALEKRLTQGLDKVEATLDKTVQKGEQLVEGGEKAVQKVTQLADKTDKTIDSMQKKAA